MTGSLVSGCSKSLIVRFAKIHISAFSRTLKAIVQPFKTLVWARRRLN